jgi:hypothetical protein
LIKSKGDLNKQEGWFMKRITLALMTALLAAGYSSASFATDTTSSSGSSVGVGQSSTDYYRHRRHHHCRRGWYDDCDAADADSGSDSLDME